MADMSRSGVRSNSRYQPGGGYVSWAFRFSYEPKEDTRYGLRFDNNGSADGQDSILRIRDVMLTEGTAPAAWAPAEGETLPGGGCSDER